MPEPPRSPASWLSILARPFGRTRPDGPCSISAAGRDRSGSVVRPSPAARPMILQVLGTAWRAGGYGVIAERAGPGRCRPSLSQAPRFFGDPRVSMLTRDPPREGPALRACYSEAPRAARHLLAGRAAHSGGPTVIEQAGVRPRTTPPDAGSGIPAASAAKATSGSRSDCSAGNEGPATSPAGKRRHAPGGLERPGCQSASGAIARVEGSRIPRSYTARRVATIPPAHDHGEPSLWRGCRACLFRSGHIRLQLFFRRSQADVS